MFAIDRVSEAVLVERFAEIAREWPCLLVAEGLGADGRLHPAARNGAVGASRSRSSSIRSTGRADSCTRSARPGSSPASPPNAPGQGPAPDAARAPRLSDIALAVQTEIPLVKQHLADQLWAIAGDGGARAERRDRLTGARAPLALRPSAAATTLHGFGGIARFFPGARAQLAAIDDEVAAALLGPPRAGVAQSFEDQYISTGGQLYELCVGHDRWIADLRPLIDAKTAVAWLCCCHPYDLCTELIAREAGVVVTGARGGAVDAPLDVFTDVAWIGYANATLRDQIAPVLTEILEKRGLIAPGSPSSVTKLT